MQHSSSGAYHSCANEHECTSCTLPRTLAAHLRPGGTVVVGCDVAVQHSDRGGVAARDSNLSSSAAACPQVIVGVLEPNLP